MKFFAVGFTVIALLSGVVAKGEEVGNLPAHLSWTSGGVSDFKFRIAEIRMRFSVGDLDVPQPIDRSELASCANWFVHYWQRAESIVGLRSLLGSDDEFQTSNPFERLSKNDRALLERSYNHIVDFEGFLFLIGTVRDKENQNFRVVGTYRWDGETNRFDAILDTPRFRDVSGWEFRRALYTIELNTVSQNTAP